RERMCRKACQPEWYRESRLFVPGRQAFLFWFRACGHGQRAYRSPFGNLLFQQGRWARKEKEINEYEEDDFRRAAHDVAELL
ncbi:MAG: hypothetical protein MSP08_02565, partial [Clostridiales bacterium]|nr:hypothetical protein [Clostridiales bacterium]